MSMKIPEEEVQRVRKQMRQMDFRLEAKVIPLKQMSPEEPYGDYIENPDGSWSFLIGDTGIHTSNMLTLIHEIAEWFLTDIKGIPEPVIRAFDKKFEEERKKGLRGKHDEPGDAKDSPYRDEHRFAEGIASLIAAYLGLPWGQYEEDYIKLCK